jgi:flagella basal body P-ring formation protein FlgA
VSISVNAIAAGHTVGSRLVHFSIRTFENRPVVTRRVYAGQPLDETNTAMKRVETTDEHHKGISLARPQGIRLAKRNLPLGEVLDRKDFRRETLVRRGQPVTLVARIGSVRVTCTGRALGDGALGDRVGVEGLDEKGRRNGNRVFGIVKGTGTVEVEVRR